MIAVRRLIRHVFFMLFFVVPFALFGALFDLRWGSLIGAGFGLLLVLTFLFAADRFWVLLLGAERTAEFMDARLVQASARLAVLQAKKPMSPSQIPELYVFSHPYSSILVVKSWGSKGRILLSRSFLDRALDSQFIDLMELALRRTQTFGLFRVTAAGALCEWVSRQAPSPGWGEWWVSHSLGVTLGRVLKPVEFSSGIRALLLMPIVWFFGRMSRDLPWELSPRNVDLRSSWRVAPGVSDRTKSIGESGLSLQLPLTSE